LRKGITLLVATPGRLLDHLKTTEAFQISCLEWIILDEADHLLELGFEDSIIEILKTIRGKRKEGLANPRVILCSATIQRNVKQLAELTMDKDPLFIQVSKKESKSIKSKEQLQEISVPAQLVQSFATVPPKLRLVSLIGLLKHITSSEAESHIIIFVSCRDSVDFHYDLLCSTSSIEKYNGDMIPNFSSGLVSSYIPGSKIYKLHGNMQQADRIKSFEGFTKSSESNILLCTDVAARGLDLPNITDIIQYDPPADIKDYIHRIGRSGRMGRSGKSFLFLLPSEQEYNQILSSHGLSLLEHNILPFLHALDKDKNYETAANNLQSKLENFILSNQAVSLYY
jgi:ATP-dependent RNA helicase DDX31/DBP7